MIKLTENGYASFETAKKVKAKGYNKPCNMILRIINFQCDSMDPEVRKDPANWSGWEGIESYDPLCHSYEEKIANGAVKKQVVVPLTELHIIQKWFRDEHKLHVTIYSCSQESWMYRITKQGQKLEEGIYAEDFSSYEEALDNALREMCELI